jgi:hypothetical protein
MACTEITFVPSACLTKWLPAITIKTMNTVQLTNFTLLFALRCLWRQMKHYNKCSDFFNGVEVWYMWVTFSETSVVRKCQGFQKINKFGKDILSCVLCFMRATYTTSEVAVFVYLVTMPQSKLNLEKCFGNLVQLCVISLCRCRKKKLAPWRESPRDKGCLSNCQMDGLVQIKKKYPTFHVPSSRYTWKTTEGTRNEPRLKGSQCFLKR